MTSNFFDVKQTSLKNETVTGFLERMDAYTQILYQIVFGTRSRRKVLLKKNREELFKYINGLLAAKRCHLYRINGVEDHIHIVTHLHPSVSLASLVKDIKLASTHYIKQKNLFPKFQGWQAGYGAFTYSIEAKDNLINYVKNQEIHHRKISYEDELIDLLTKSKVAFEMKYLQ